MPKKPNAHGMQEYIPAGNGDASGEYADGEGSNKHFTLFRNPEQDISSNSLDANNKEGSKSEKRIDNSERNDIISEHAKTVISDVEEKNRHLSYEVGTVIGKDGNILAEQQGDDHSVEIDGQLLQGAIFTHNHPRGTCLSTDDIKSFVESNLYQLRATSPEGFAYVLTKTKGFVEPSLVQDYYYAGKMGHEGSERVQELYEQKIELGYSGYDAFLKAVSDFQIEWLTENAKKYYVDFKIE